MLLESNGIVVIVTGAAIALVVILLAILSSRRPRRILPQMENTSQNGRAPSAHAERSRTRNGADRQAIRQPIETEQIETGLAPNSEASPNSMSAEIAGLSRQQKHRIVYHFLPIMKGLLLEDKNLDDALRAAVKLARAKGWSEARLAASATDGRWSLPNAHRHRTVDQ